MTSRLSYIFWSIVCVITALSCGAPAAKPVEQGGASPSASASAPADASKSSEGAQERTLKHMQAGCFDRCVETQGSEAPCEQFCACLMGKLRENEAVMQELMDPKTAQAPPSAAFQDAIVAATSGCSGASTFRQPEYDPRALRSLIGTKVSVVTDHTPAPTPPAKEVSQLKLAAQDIVAELARTN